jgi:hypothetical protein
MGGKRGRRGVEEKGRRGDVFFVTFVSSLGGLCCKFFRRNKE